jgi:hypothetical protein
MGEMTEAALRARHQEFVKKFGREPAGGTSDCRDPSYQPVTSMGPTRLTSSSLPGRLTRFDTGQTEADPHLQA